MPSTSTTRRTGTKGKRLERARERWVRKNLFVDQRKLDAAKRLLNVATETDAVDAALDEVAFRRGVLTGIRALRRAGGLATVFD